VRPEPSRGLDASDAVSSGALRGLLAGLVYAVALVVFVTVSDATRADLEPMSAGDVAEAVLFFVPFVAGIAVFVGALGGALLGLACLPVTRRLRPWPAAVACGVAVAALCTAAFPYVPLGSRPDDLEEFLTLSLLPGLLAGLAAAWHAFAMSRLAHPVTQVGPGPEGPGPHPWSSDEPPR
jgi:hypothetical protein